MAPQIPRVWKRRIYAVSINGLLYVFQHPDQRILDKLNNLFRVISRSEGAFAPITFRKIVWSDLDKSRSIRPSDLPAIAAQRSEITIGEIDVASRYLATNVPSWLRYGSIELLAADARAVLRTFLTQRQVAIV